MAAGSDSRSAARPAAAASSAAAASDVPGAEQANPGRFFLGESRLTRPPSRSSLRCHSHGPTAPTAPPPTRPSPPFECVLHLPLGSVAVDASEPFLCLGRGRPELPDDLRLSRRHALISFDAGAPTATLTWMARKPGRVQFSGSSGREEVLVSAGAQRVLRHGDTLSLLADCGRHLCLISIGAGGAPARPDKRGWALLEAAALAAARAAAKLEGAEQTRLARVAIQQEQPVAAAAAAAPKNGALPVWHAKALPLSVNAQTVHDGGDEAEEAAAAPRQTAPRSIRDEILRGSRGAAAATTAASASASTCAAVAVADSLMRPAQFNPLPDISDDATAAGGASAAVASGPASAASVGSQSTMCTGSL